MSVVIQILIADDHELFRRTARSFIESQPTWRVCGEAGDGIEAIEKAKLLRPQVILMDINMLAWTVWRRHELSPGPSRLQRDHCHPESRKRSPVSKLPRSMRKAR